MFTVETQDDVDILRLDDGKVNAFNTNFVARFAKTWRKIDDEGRAVVVTGNARAFSAGLDLKQLPSMSEARFATFARDFLAVLRGVLAHPRPVVALVDGPAIAGGAALALCCDVRLATPHARMGLTEVPVGVPFPRPVLELARARLPREEQVPALLMGVVRQGAPLVEHGWAHELVEAPDAQARAVALAKELAGHSGLAYKRAKMDLVGYVLDAFDAFEKQGADEWAALLQRDETRAALARTLDRLGKK